MSQEQDVAFVEFVVKGIVNNPDGVKVSRKVDEMGVLIEVEVAPEDMGLLIGRSGATAKAIRILTRIVGMKNNARVNLRIIEPEGSTRAQSTSVPAPTDNTPTKDDTPADSKPTEGKTKSIDDVVGDLGV